jgi:translocation and assembly module TamB
LKRRWIVGSFVVAAVALVVAAALALRSDWFREQVRLKLVREIEIATGGRVEIGWFDYHWNTLEVEAGAVVVHGLERGGQAPLFRARLIRLTLGPGTLLERRLDIRKLRIERPEAHIYVAADRTTNLPHPAGSRKGNTIEELLKLHIGEAEIVAGEAEVAARKIDFDGRLQGFESELRYAARPERYETRLKIERVEVPGVPALGVEGELALEATRLRASRVLINVGQSWLSVDGALENFARPNAAGHYRSEFNIRDLAKGSLRAGEFKVAGDWSWSPESWRATARARGLGMVFMILGRPAEPISAEGTCEIVASGIHCGTLTGSLLGGALAGSGAWRAWNRLEIAGELTGVDVAHLRPLFHFLPPVWEARATGEANFSAAWRGGDLSETVLGAKLKATPANGHWPLRAAVEFEYRQAGETVRFGPSTLDTASSHVSFEGLLDERLELTLNASDAKELEDGLRKGMQRDDIHLPFRLEQGALAASGTLTGPLERPTASGTLRATNAVYEDVRFDELEVTGLLAPEKLDLKNVRIRQGAAVSSGTMSVSLSEWRLIGASRMDATLTLRKMNLGELSRALRLTAGVGGTTDATLRIQGTYDRPEASVQIDAPEILWRGEKIERVKGRIRFHNDGREVVEADLIADGARIVGQGLYDHPSGTWASGRLEFNGHLTQMALSKLENLMAARPGLEGVLEAELAGAIRVNRGEARLESLSGRILADQLTLEGAALGRVEVLVRPETGRSRIEISALVEGVRVMGLATLGFDGDSVLEGQIEAPRLPLRLIRTITSTPAPGQPLGPMPVRGFVEGQLRGRIPLARPEEFTASATIARVEIRPSSDQILDTQIDPSDLTLRNAGAIHMEADRNGVRMEAAKFTARETDLTLAGGYAFNSRTPWDVHLTGSVNLAVAGSFRTDLQAAGTARLDATLRGPADDPQLSGRMTISNGSLFLKDVPNGIADASGTVYFERNRANIEKITGHTGSGTFELSGFVAFGNEINFRLQGKAANVRVRYPEGVSTLLDADLALVGSPARSLLAGTLTIARSGFNTKTDMAAMVAQSGSPLPLIATDNEFLRNLQFDVRVRTTPNATLVSQYTQEVQTEADLRLRGSLIKPVVLGRVLVHQGLVQFFGNRYTISRGELLFYSTATLAPSLDLDLETRIRGVTVYINVSGPLNRLKVNYRSEPPLQASEILALLTVGRAPVAQSTALPTAPGTGNPALTEDSTNSLLGGALSGAVSARVERLFGASRIKIDPQVTGVDNIPQARITVEQSISPDVTMTFVTNLHQAQQQVVQFEWNLSREWALVAVRDENGIFGIDFLFKKRFK